MLFKDFLNDTAYQYYPKGMYAFDLNYNSSLENKKLMEKIHECNLNSIYIEKFINDLNYKIKPYSAQKFQMGGDFPSYNFQILLDSNEDHVKVLSLHISFLIPYFHITILKGNFNLLMDKISVIKNKEFAVLELIETIKFELQAKLLYNEFPIETLFEKIPKLYISENFSYFNAFFIDNYRILNF